MLGVNVNVTNMTGGAGVRASQYVLSQPADGYTIYNFSPEQLINTAFGRENYSEEFAPLCQVQQDISFFYVNPDGKFKNIDEIVAYAKENPGKVRFTGTTPASPDETIIKLWAQKMGIEVDYIPYDKAPETHAAVLGGHLEVLHEEPGVILSLIEAGKLKPVLIFAEERLERFPDVPTAKEKGADVTMGRWRGLAVKKGTPQEIIDYLASVMYEASQDPAYTKVAAASLLDIRPGWKGPEEFGKFWDEQYENYYNIFKGLGYIKE
jgi:tripartite-type tricarboxylate transporter receptor subunit TctC